MENIYVFGHKNPDTDSVCSAISLSYLKTKIGIKGVKPKILGPINKETKFVLDYFEVKEPEILNNVKNQLKNISYNNKLMINRNSSISNAYYYMSNNNVSGLPIVDGQNKYIGYVSLKEIATHLINNKSSYIDTNYNTIITLLDGKSILENDYQIKGDVLAITDSSESFINNGQIDENSIVVIGKRDKIIDYSIDCHAKLLILVNGAYLTKDEKAKAIKNKINIISTNNHTYETLRQLFLANNIESIIRNEKSVTFDKADYLDYFYDVSNRLKHTNYPIVNQKGICEGMLKITDTKNVNKKKVILVDHNDINQSVEGLEEAEILEIVDHHGIGDINTKSPINFRNMAVGSTNTILYFMYRENGVKIPQNIAGLMLSGIISDTLLLKSPTSTEKDKYVMEELSKIAKVDYKKYGLKLLEAGMNFEGMTKRDVIYKDFKSYVTKGNKIGIGQVLTTEFKNIEKELNEYVKELDSIAYQEGYLVLCLFVTNILADESYILYNTQSNKIIEESFDITNVYQGYCLKNILSRKKQIAPYLMEAVEKY